MSETTSEPVLPGGNRRIDRLLGEGSLDSVPTMPLDELRALREEADQEETDLSYLRRLVQGRADIVAAEVDRRSGAPGASSGDLVDDLPRILGEGAPRTAAFGMGRHSAKEPSRTGEARRYVEGLVADAALSSLAERTDDELTRALDRLRLAEQEVSARRREVQGVLDACSAEITRRYRDGEADVADLLPEVPAG